MQERYDRSGCKTDIFKADENIQQHKNDRYENCDHSSLSHLASDCRRDIVRRDGGRFHVEILPHGIREGKSLLHIQRAGLDDDLIIAHDLLQGYVGIPCNIHYDRLYFRVELLKGIIFLEFNCSRCTAEELKGEIQRPRTSCGIDSHRSDSDGNHEDRDSCKHFLLCNKIELRLVFLSCPEFRIPYADRIDRVHDESGDDTGCDHGKRYTKCERHGKALDRAASEIAQDRSCDQCCNIAVQDSGHGFMESGLDRSEHRCPGIDLLPDTRIDNNVRVDRHTDRKNNTGDTRKGKCKVECVQEHQHDRRIQSKYERSDGTRHKINDDHDDADDRKTDRAAHDGCADRSLAELSADNIRSDLIQCKLQTADPDIGCKLFGLLHRLHACDLGFAV